MMAYYADDYVTLYHGDCRAILPGVGGDVMVTDPPYGMAYSSGWSGASVAGDTTTDVRDAILNAWFPRPALVFGRWSCPRPADVRHTLIWDKGDWPGMGDLSLPWGPSTEEIYVIGEGFVGKRRGSIIRDTKRPSGESALHPTEKPIGLMETLLRACPPGIIVDPFAGSGSTLVAAKNLGRHAIGVEINESYCKIIATRLTQEVLNIGGAA
jgi:DNA modification methylase